MSDAGSFYDDILEEMNELPAGRKIKNEFKPWHHPRKNFVRIYQWLSYIDKYKERVISSGVMNYLSLPGDDLLDLRLIHDKFCVENKIKLKFLGFNDHNKDADRTQEANLSLVEVKELPFIDHSSQVIDNDIMKIGTTQSLSYQRAKQHGAYDVINLDFCDSITFRNPERISENHYKLLSMILHIQNSRDNPWLLFVTTRVGKEHINNIALNKLLECFNSNMEHEVFKDKVKEILNVDCDKIDIEDIKSDKVINNIVLVALCKWLLSISLSLPSRTVIKVLSSMSYKVKPDAVENDMVSFALLFTPNPQIVPDKYKLAVVDEDNSLGDEPTISSAYIGKFNADKDCDALLLNRDDIKEEMIKQTMILLKLARYDISNYRSEFT